MKKFALILALLPVAAMAETDAEMNLLSALYNTRAKCGDISQDLTDLKKMAGISTAVNAAGTAVGIGGVVAGAAKWKADKAVAENMGKKMTHEMIKEKITQQYLSAENQAVLEKFRETSQDIDWDDVEQKFEKYARDYAAMNAGEKKSVLTGIDADIARDQAAIDAAQKKSDTLGNVRTGLFATNTATSVAGAVLSSKTGLNQTLQEKIKTCLDSLNNLQEAQSRVRFEDGENANVELVQKSQNVMDKCGAYSKVDADKLNKMAKGGVITGSVGAATGLAATITSIAGTKNKLSNVDLRSEDAMSDVNKIGATNIASNTLGGVTAATSAAGTVLNAIQIKKVQEVVTISQECEEALQ